MVGWQDMVFIFRELASDTANAMNIDIDGINVITIDDNNNAAFITKQHTFTAQDHKNVRI